MKVLIKSLIKPIYYSLSPKNRSKLIYVHSRLFGTDRYKVKKRKCAVFGDISKITSFQDNSGQDFIIFPVIDWNFRIQRPQQISKGIAKLGSNVFYISNEFNLDKNPGFEILDISIDNVYFIKINLDTHINIYIDQLSRTQIGFLLQGIVLLRESFNIGHVNSIINFPFWYSLAKEIPASNIIYDCMDYHAGFENCNKNIIDEEEKLLKGSDLVITTSSKLSKDISSISENIIIRNGCEADFFSKKPAHVFIEKKRPIIGYYGAIAEWFDVDILVDCARAYPAYDFIIIGAVTRDIESTKQFDNIKFLGEIPYSELTGYLYSFDVCLIPFILTELILCTNPVKIYEYLAAGKPVVTTAMPEAILMDEFVHIGYDSEQFVKLIEVAMSESKNKTLEASRINWAKQHDWDSRSLFFLKECEKIISKKVSIVVLTYNNLHLTKECLYSILHNTKYNNYEVIIVDNNSNDGTKDYLIENYSNRNNFTVILNEDNVGFAAGNNIGIGSTSGEIIVILNNDTYVAPFWLGSLVQAFDRNPNLGIVGPVTNNIGNEAKINISYNSWSEMKQLSYTYTSINYDRIYDASCLAFFCVAIKRDVYDAIGGLCEDYGLGFFEDDDYCMRVKKAGYQLGIVESSFVHHHLSASFNKLKDNKKNKLMEKNKKIFESKWGEWKPHSYRKGVY